MLLLKKISKLTLILAVSLNLMLLDFQSKTLGFSTVYAQVASTNGGFGVNYGWKVDKTPNGDQYTYLGAANVPFEYDSSKSYEENKKLLNSHYQKYGYPEANLKSYFLPSPTMLQDPKTKAQYQTAVDEFSKIENYNSDIKQNVVDRNLIKYSEKAKEKLAAEKLAQEKIAAGMRDIENIAKESKNGTSSNTEANTTAQAQQAGGEVSGAIQVVEGKDIKSSSWAATLTMVSIGILTSRLISCRMTLDMVMAAAAGAAFIAGEAIAFIKLRKALDGFKVELDLMAKQDKFDSQKQALIKIRNGYQKALETAEFKRNLQMVAAAAFVAAAGAAGLAGIQNTGGLVACNASLAGAATACQGMYAASCPKCYVPFLTGGLKATATAAKTTAHNIKMKIIGNSVAKEAESTATEGVLTASIATAAASCPAVSAAAGPCNAFFGLRKMNSGACAMPSLIVDRYQEKINNNTFTIEDLKATNPSYWNKMMNIIFPEAKAFDLAGIGILASSAAKFVLATNKALALKLDTFLHEPYNRMKIWLAMAGLTYMAKGSTEEVIAQLKQYIAKIDGVIAGYEEQKLGIGVASGNKPNTPDMNFLEVSKESALKLPGGKDSEVNLNGGAGSKTASSSTNNSNNSSNKSTVSTEYDLGQKMPCLGGTGSGGKCNSFNDMLTGSSNFSKLDTGMQKQFQNMAKTLDSLNGTDKLSSANLADLNAIASNSARDMSKVKDDMIKKYKIPKEELTGIEKNQNELLDEINKELKKENTSAERMYASFNGVNPTGFNSSKDAKNTADAKKSEGGSSTANGAQGTLAALGISGLGLGKDSLGFGDSSKNKNGIDHAAAQAEIKVGSDAIGDGTNASAGVDADKINEIAGQFGDNEFIDLSKISGDLDINKEDDTSLFQVITNRYQKTGYSRLFPNKKVYEIDAQR